MKTNWYFRPSFGFEQWVLLRFLGKWLSIALIIGIAVGLASALFLFSLEWVTSTRDKQQMLYWFLPVAGFSIGLMYHYFGQEVIKGNNQLLDEIQKPEKTIPFKMAPLVLIGTLLTHLVGGSAGREGTAVQMGGSIADQLTKWFHLKERDRKIIIIMGISAGFASVFGTPLAGTIFSLEVLIIGRIRYEALLPSFFAAVIADYVCHLTGALHTFYPVQIVTVYDAKLVFLAVFSGIIFGLTALLFSKSGEWWNRLFKKISFAPFRPIIGGVVLSLIFFSTSAYDYAGLGIPVIKRSFTEVQSVEVFILKLLFTTFTLSAGFKGGEVTPLFFIGASLGSFLSGVFSVPTDLWAAIGFVAVFAGATNTPLACIFMGIELFGAELGVYIAATVLTAYLFSGHSGIYGSQIIGSPKHALFIRKKGKQLTQVDSINK